MIELSGSGIPPPGCYEEYSMAITVKLAHWPSCPTKRSLLPGPTTKRSSFGTPLLRRHAEYSMVIPTGSTRWTSPDGKILASSSDDSTVRLWNTGDGQAVAVFKMKGSICTLSVSACGSSLVTSRGSCDINFSVPMGHEPSCYPEDEFWTTQKVAAKGVSIQGAAREGGKGRRQGENVETKSVSRNSKSG